MTLINRIIFFVIIFLFYGCNSNPNSEEKKLGVPDKKEIVSAENNARSEIIGLWKLYKKSYGSSEPIIEVSNEFFEIKDNNTFEETRSNGAWILSFTAAPEGSSQDQLIFTKILDGKRYSCDTKSYYLTKTVENNTTFLKLSSLSSSESREGFIYIRQK